MIELKKDHERWATIREEFDHLQGLNLFLINNSSDPQSIFSSVRVRVWVTLSAWTVLFQTLRL